MVAMSASTQTAAGSSTTRRDKRQVVASCVAIAAFLAAGGIWWARGGSDRREKREWNAVLQCAACGHRYDANVKLTFPLAAQICPSCEKDAAWEMKYCSKCDHAFLPPVAGDPPRPPPMPACPKCTKNDDVGALVPGFSTHGEAG